MEGEHYVYVSSLGSLDIHPNNKTDAFANNIFPPIKLNPEKEDEMALVECFYPDNLLCITENDKDTYIDIYFKFAGNIRYRHFLKYTPGVSIEKGDIQYITETINKELCEELNTNVLISFEKDFSHKSIISWDREMKKVSIKLEDLKNEDTYLSSIMSSVGFKFSTRMGRVLGFDSNHMYPYRL